MSEPNVWEIVAKLRELREAMDRDEVHMRFVRYGRCEVVETNIGSDCVRGNAPCDTEFANFAANNVMKLCDALEKQLADLQRENELERERTRLMYERKEHYKRQLAMAQANQKMITNERDDYIELLRLALSQEPKIDGKYVHLPHCNGDWNQMPGTPGITCCCLPKTKERVAQLEARAISDGNEISTQAAKILALEAELAQAKEQMKELDDECSKQVGYSTEMEALSEKRKQACEAALPLVANIKVVGGAGSVTYQDCKEVERQLKEAI